MITQIIDEHLAVIKKIRDEMTEDIQSFADICIRALQTGGKLCFCGNGGSAADAQHLAAEFVGRFVKERRGLPAIAFTTDTSILTAVANDYGYDTVFERQVEALIRPGDVLIGLSTSGNSASVVKAIVRANELGATTIGLTGPTGGKMAAICSLCIKVPAKETARIQEAHALIGHIVCALADEVSL